VLFVRLDRRIADLMLARAQRRWPLLRLVPRPYIRAVIQPAAHTCTPGCRRAAARGALLVGVLLALIPMF
jgi:hypothetical protein